MSDENKQENEENKTSFNSEPGAEPKHTQSLEDSPINSPAKSTKESEENRQENENQKTSFDTETETSAVPKHTQSLEDSPVNSPAKSTKESEKETVQFEDKPPQLRQAKPYDPTKDTAVLSRDNPLLRRALNNQSDDEPVEGTTTLGEKREVILLIRGMAERVVMQEGIIYQLGRFELGMAAPNEVDLTPYGAMDRGVSRVHAQLHLQDDHLYITDLSSTNGTYVSGNKIEANTPTALRKGDELLLGRLQVQILFR